MAVANGIELIWETYMELDHDYFRIDKSRDARNWVEIGIMDGMGQSYELRSYVFVDESPCQEDYYYRLVALDNQGVEDFSEVINVRCTNESQIMIWPQIFALSDQNVMNVSGLNEGNYRISIMNSGGQRLQRESYFQGGLTEIPISQTLGKGYYFIQIQNESMLYTDGFYID